MTLYVVTIARRGHRKRVMFHGHRIQHATVGVAAIHRGWFVVDVIVVGRRKRGVGTTAADKPSGQHEAGHATTASIVPHRLPVRLIPDPEDVRRFRNELAHRQEVRMDAHLPLLDLDAEIERFVTMSIVSDYRDRLEPYLNAILRTTERTGGMVATLWRHKKALSDAGEQLFQVEGVLPPSGQLGAQIAAKRSGDQH